MKFTSSAPRMTEKPDLTRWNRAGLRRFRYVDGNAATYLEALRQELLARFTGWDMELLGFKLASDDPKERQKALEEHFAQFGKDHQQALDNYLKLNDNRGSIALEMIRSFARAAHVLTEHLDAYANEGFIGTATQWENVRRLVHGLDYHPKPPASAMTHLVLHAKPGQSGLVARGLKTKHTPEEGSPVTFETLEDIQVDSTLNALRLKDWDCPQETAEVQGDGKLVLEGTIEGLNLSDPVIIQCKDGLLLPCLLKRIGTEGKNTALYLDLPSDSNKNLGSRSDVIVHLKPAERLGIRTPSAEEPEADTHSVKESGAYTPLEPRALKSGKSSLVLSEDPVLSSGERLIEEGSYVFIGKGNEGVFRVVSEVEGRLINLIPGEDVGYALDYLGKPEKLDKGKVVIIENLSETDLENITPAELEEMKKNKLEGMTGTEFFIIDGKVTVLGDKRWLKDNGIDGDILACMGAGLYKPCKVSGAIQEPNTKATELTLVNLDGTALNLSEVRQILLPPSENQWKWKIDNFVDITNDLLEVDIVRRIDPGDLCVVACDKNFVAARVESVVETGAGRFDLRIADRQPVEQSEGFIASQTVVYGKFKEQFRLGGTDVNEEGISGESTLSLENAEVAKNLKVGKPIVIEHEGTESGQSFLASIKSVNALDGEEGASITLDSPLPEGYTTGGTIIRANIVLAGHGETQPERILGSGNAALSNQEFLFPVSDVSFVTDETQASGVRADIHVIVDGETWTQVSRFNQSRAADLHYVVRMTEEGYLRILFGDGINGRRLPTAENNVRIAWRMGSGTAGNLKAGTLKKLAHPHPRVEAIEQPFSCAGGNDMESVTSLRRNAPASLLTMERAVSVNDFALLAQSQSSVWSARAEQCGERVVRVIVVLADGGKLSEHLSLSEDIKAFLLSRAIPGAQVILEDYVSEALSLDITLGIDSKRFDMSAVIAEVRKTLLQRFTLKNRAIGAPVYLSDIYQCVEAVRGIEYSVCKFEGSARQFLYPEDPQKGVLHITNENNGIILSHEEAKK